MDLWRAGESDKKDIPGRVRHNLLNAMAPTPSNPTPFDLGQEIGSIHGKLNLLMERTEGLPQMAVKVERHDTELRAIKTFGYLSGLGIIGVIGGWLKAKFGW